MSTGSAAAQREATVGEKQSIFILGTERSGTNLLRRILGTHSDISAPHPIESSFPAGFEYDRLHARQVRSLIRDVLVTMYFSHHTLHEAVSVDEVHRRVVAVGDNSLLSLQRAFYEAFTEATGTSRWVSKWPSNIQHVTELDAFYDEPKYLHLVRDCRDNVLSKKNNASGQFHPYLAAETWRDEQERLSAFTEDTERDVHLVRYEDILRDPESAVRSICEYLNCEFEPAMLHYYQADESKREAEKHHAFKNLSSPIKSNNFGKFRDGLTEEETVAVEAVAGELLERYGYDLVTDETERDAFAPDVERYREIDRQRRKRHDRERWRNDPVEQVRVEMQRNFRRYMWFRYSFLSL